MPSYERTDEIKAKNYTKERAEKIRQAKLGKKRGHWYNDGTSNFLIQDDDNIPNSLVKGFLYHHTDETKEHLSSQLKGRVFSEEHNTKVAAAKKEYWKEHSVKIKCNETGEILPRQEWLNKGYASIDRAARTGGTYKGFTFSKCEL